MSDLPQYSVNMVCKRISVFFASDEFQGKFQERFNFGKITPIKGTEDVSKYIRSQFQKEALPYVPCVETVPISKTFGTMRDMEEIVIKMRITIPSRYTQSQMALQPEGYYECNYNDDLEPVANFLISELSQQMTLGAVFKNGEIIWGSAISGNPLSSVEVALNFFGNPATLGGA